MYFPCFLDDTTEREELEIRCLYKLKNFLGNVCVCATQGETFQKCKSRRVSNIRKKGLISVLYFMRKEKKTSQKTWLSLLCHHHCVCLASSTKRCSSWVILIANCIKTASRDTREKVSRRTEIWLVSMKHRKKRKCETGRILVMSWYRKKDKRHTVIIIFSPQVYTITIRNKPCQYNFLLTFIQKVFVRKISIYLSKSKLLIRSPSRIYSFSSGKIWHTHFSVYSL